MRSDLPTGTVTFLFTDVEGSTNLLHELGPERYAEALAEHRRIVREASAPQGGVEVDTQGDAFFFAFPTAPGALAAARDLTDTLAAGPVQVRVGMHTGTPLVTDEGYVGPDVHRAARIAASGHGGQVLVSASTADLVDLELRDLGAHRFKDLAAAERVFQLGDGEFPALNSLYRTNLPVPATAFLGRERELAEVVELLTRPETRLLTLTGPGGTGKTRLGLQSAAEASDRYPDGVFWVPLAPLREPILVASAMTQALGVQEQPGRAALDVLCERLAGNRMLVLLDNAEHLLPDLARTVSEVHAVSGPTLLVTSRERLQVAGEHAYAVPELDAEDAVDFFLARAAAAAVELSRTREVDDLCARLERLPLALELAAARSVVFTPEQLLERLAHRLDLLKGGRDADPRQQTLRTTIEWSHDLLDAAEQRLFRALSVFAGGCTYEAAEQVAGADPDTLQSLLEKSLLRRRTTDHGPRYWMLETIREYAQERLDGSGEGDLLRERHGTSLVELVSSLGSSLRDMDPDAVARFEPENDNVAQAITASLDAGAPEVAFELVGRLCSYWVTMGRLAEGLARGDRLLRAEGGANSARIACILGLSELYAFGGDPQRGIALKEQALEMLADVGDDRIPSPSGNSTKDETVATTLKDLAQWHAMYGDLEKALLFAEEAVVRAREHGSDRFIVHAVYARGIVEFHAGRHARARRDFEDSLTIRPNSPAVDDGGAHLMIGECLRREGRVDEAIRELRTGLDLLANAGAVTALPEVMQEFAAVAAARGRLEVGAALLGRSEHLWRQMHLTVWDPEDFERTTSVVRDGLGTRRFDEERERGAALTDDEALELARSID